MNNSAPLWTVLFAGHAGEDQKTMQNILRHSDWHVDHASTCLETLERCQKGRVPVVICNHDLAGGGWQRVLERITDMPDPPALIVSSRLADQRLWAEVLNLGGYDVFQTPFDADEVLRVLRLAASSWTHRISRQPPRAAIVSPPDTKSTPG